MSRELSISQKQAVVKFIEKQTEIKDWSKTGGQYLYLTLMRDLFLSKVLTKRIKKYLPLLTFSNQTVYVDKRLTNAGGFDLDLDLKKNFK